MSCIPKECGKRREYSVFRKGKDRHVSSSSQIPALPDLVLSSIVASFLKGIRTIYRYDEAGCRYIDFKNKKYLQKDDLKVSHFARESKETVVASEYLIPDIFCF